MNLKSRESLTLFQAVKSRYRVEKVASPMKFHKPDKKDDRAGSMQCTGFDFSLIGNLGYIFGLKYPQFYSQHTSGHGIRGIGVLNEESEF
jgi:hypothetical protein